MLFQDKGQISVINRGLHWNTRMIEIRDTYLCMLTGIETLAALFTTQTFRMPVVAQRLFTFRCDGQTHTRFKYVI